jgi:rhamnosyl/mannosyltransferase
MVEAMSFGKPVVATKIPHSGVQWVNRHKVTGLNVEPKNPKALAYAIRQILENNQLYRRMSENALKRYREKFSVEKESDSRPAASSVVSSAV